MVEYNIEYPYNEIILESVTHAYLLIYGAKKKPKLLWFGEK